MIYVICLWCFTILKKGDVTYWVDKLICCFTQMTLRLPSYDFLQYYIRWVNISYMTHPVHFTWIKAVRFWLAYEQHHLIFVFIFANNHSTNIMRTINSSGEYMSIINILWSSCFMYLQNEYSLAFRTWLIFLLVFHKSHIHIQTIDVHCWHHDLSV